MSSNMSINKGWLSLAEKIPSPHFNLRPCNESISLLVIHNISLPPANFEGQYVEAFFCGKLNAETHPYFAEIAALKVSSHLYIRRNGEIKQFVSFNDRAWHAGQSEFLGRENCNDYSIGIEMEGCDDIAYTDIQYDQLAKVTRLLQQEYPQLTQANIQGHCHIAPQRKTDPGDSFDWTRYFNALS
jgi:N-acetyl-anhydromuramoyl-L-alanine amidase